MAKKNSKTQMPPPPPGPEATADELAAYFEKYTLRELEAAGYFEELTPEDLKYVDEIAKGQRKNNYNDFSIIQTPNDSAGRRQ